MKVYSDNVRRIIDDYKKDPEGCIGQVEFCEYGCEAGVLKNNLAWIAIKELLIDMKNEG